MPYCSKCGQKVADDALFCQRCGAPIAPADGARTGRRETWEGTVHKCPSCGAEVGSFMSACPVCGHELRGVGANESVREFEERLSSVSSGKKRDAMIRSFYIPNTREDIYEFFILADSNIKAGGENVDAWRAKLEQALTKAELVFGESPELERIDKMYKEAHSKGVANRMKNSKWLQAAVLFTVGAVMAFVGYSNMWSGSGFGYTMLGMIGLLPIFLGVNLIANSTGAASDNQDDSTGKHLSKKK